MRAWILAGLLATSAAAQDAPKEFKDNLFTFNPIILSRKHARQRIEFTLHRWGDGEGEEAFTLSIATKPAFVTEASWSATSVKFGPDDDRKELTISLVLDGKGEGDLVLLVKADDEDVAPRERRFVLPLRFEGAPRIAEGKVQAFVAKEGAPDFKLADAHKHVDPEAKPITLFDTVFVFFTPAIEIDTEEEIDFYAFVNRSDGSGPWWIRFAGKSAGIRFLSVVATSAGAPQPYVARFLPHSMLFRASIGGPHDMVTTPIAYDHGLLGLPIPKPGERTTVGTFDVVAPLLHLQGVVVERGVKLPIELSAARGGGGRYTVAARALDRNASGRLTLEVPELLDMRGEDRKDSQSMISPATAAEMAKGFVYGKAKASMSGAGWSATVLAPVPMRGHAERTLLIHGWGKVEHKETAWVLRTGGSSAGKPSRGLAYLYRDPDIRWYLPVRIGFGKSAVHAYAVYKGKPGADAGPGARGEGGDSDASDGDGRTPTNRTDERQPDRPDERRPDQPDERRPDQPDERKPDQPDERKPDQPDER
ncbi:MAG: hypothetical protein OER88_10585, partial [Planctomycetota bacterium]|nr:hypothetical protein [Planctomycetota bacterium]